LGKNEIYDKELPHSWTDYLDDYPNFLCRTEFFFKEPVGTPVYPSGIPDMHTIHDPMISMS
jgi:hypothetical protein